MRKRLIALLLCLSLLLLTGCWDSNELSSQIFAIYMGLDEGETMPLRVTLQLPAITKAGSGGSSAGPIDTSKTSSSIIDESLLLNGYVLAQAEGNTLIECLDALHAVIPRSLSLIQLRGLFVSESIARSGTLFDSLSRLLQPRQTRPTAYVYVCRGRAEDVMRENNPSFGARLSKSIISQTEALQKESVIANLVLIDFYNRLLDPGADAYAIQVAVNNMQYMTETAPRGIHPAEKNAGELPVNSLSPMELYGSALFYGDTLAMFLNGYETQLLNMCLGDFITGDISVNDTSKTVQMGLQQVKAPRIKVDISGERPIISIEVSLQGSCYLDTLIEDNQLVEARAKALLENDISELLLKMQQAQTDPLDFSGHAKRNFLTMQQWDQYGWAEAYSSAGFIVKVNLTLLKNATTINT